MEWAIQVKLENAGKGKGQAQPVQGVDPGNPQAGVESGMGHLGGGWVVCVDELS